MKQRYTFGRKCLLFALLYLLYIVPSYGQANTLDYDFNLYYTQVYNKGFAGINLEARYALANKVSLGGYLDFGLSCSRSDFGYFIENPLLSQVNVGGVVQKNVFDYKRFQLNARMQAGLMINDLSEQYFDSFFGDESFSVATDYMFNMSPGFSTVLRLTNNMRQSQLYWNTKVHYRKAFGNSIIGLNQDLDGFWMSTGVSIAF